MESNLEHFAESVEEKYGRINVTRSRDRFCFHLPYSMSEYVHDHMRENEFIRELVEVISVHGTTMEKIRGLFYSHSDKVIEQRIEDGEFDYMLRFEDDPEDRYCYCFKDEGFHIIYHRFMPEDYEEFGYGKL